MLKTIRLVAVMALCAVPAFAAQHQAPAARSAMDAAMSAKAVPTAAAPSIPTTTAAAARPACPAPVANATRIDINSANMDGLDTLYGIGPSRAKDIIAERKKGLYEKPEDLVKRGVLPQSVFDCLKSRVALANVNSSSANAMAEVLNGIGAARAKAIVDGRKKGPYQSITDLTARANLPQPTADSIKDLITF